MRWDRELATFFQSAFTAAELLQWIVFNVDRAARDRLPGDNTPLAELAAATVDVLLRERRIDAELFAALIATRPRRQAEIERIRDAWQASSGATSAGDERRVDLGLLIATDREFAALAAMVSPRAERNDRFGGYDYRFDWPRADGRVCRVVATFMGGGGPERATLFSERLLAWQPAVLVNVGTAGSLDDELKVGDVVVADQIDGYLATSTAGDWALQWRGSVYRSTHALVAEVQHLRFARAAAYEAWRSACAAASQQDGVVGQAPAIHRVHLASGPIVSASPAVRASIRARDAELQAIEMEASGVMLAAHERADPARTLVLRGISEPVDTAGARVSSQVASANAIRLLRTLATEGLVP